MLIGLGKADWRMGEIFSKILENFRFSNLFPVTKDFPEYRFIKCWWWATLLSKKLLHKFTMVQRRDRGFHGVKETSPLTESELSSRFFC